MSDVPICTAAYEGKFTDVVNAIKKDPKLLYVKDASGRNILHWSACGGHLGLVKYAVNSGLKPDEPDQSGWTALMISVSAGRDDVALYFLELCDVDANAVNSTGQRPLHYAASKNRLTLANKLLAVGADPDAQDWGGNTPLHRAISLGHLEVVKVLLSGYSLSDDISDISTNSNYKTVTKKTDSPNIPNKSGQTPLHFACEEGNVSVVRLLLQAGGDPSIKDEDGRTPVELAPDNLRVAMPNELGLSRSS